MFHSMSFCFLYQLTSTIAFSAFARSLFGFLRFLNADLPMLVTPSGMIASSSFPSYFIRTPSSITKAESLLKLFSFLLFRFFFNVFDSFCRYVTILQNSIFMNIDSGIGSTNHETLSLRKKSYIPFLFVQYLYPYFVLFRKLFRITTRWSVNRQIITPCEGIPSYISHTFWNHYFL